MRIQATVAFTVMLVSCGPASLDGPRTGRDLTGYAQNSCGPADGPAVEIYLTDASPGIDAAIQWIDSIAMLSSIRQDSARAAQESPATVLRILMWRGTDQLVGQRFDIDADVAHWGDVTWCGPEGCVRVSEGNLRFTSASALEVAGEYELRAAAGGVLAGTFRAPIVQRPAPLCG